MSTKMNNDIENILAQGAQNYEVVPPEQVWKNIKKGKNSRYVFFFRIHKWRIAATLALLVIISCGLYYSNISENSKIVKSFKNTENSGIETPEIITESDIQENNENSNNEIQTGNNEANDVADNISNTKNQKSKINKNLNTISKNDDSDIKLKDEEISVNISNYDILNFESKELNALIYSVYPKLAEYTPVNKKFQKKYLKNKEKDNDTKSGTGTYSLEIGGGPSYIYRKLSGGNYLLRNESEKSMISFQTNVKVNYNFNNKFSVQSGIILETRNEKLNYNHTEINKKLIETPRMVTVFHPILPPKNITVIDSTYNNETVNYDFENLNKYTSFNIPVLFGYNFGNSKLQYRFSAGTLINIYSSNNAKIIERKGNETILSQYKESKKINPSIYTAAAVNKVINNHYSIVFELSYYKNMFNRLGSESATKQLNAGFNFTSAIRYNILR